MIKKIKNAVDQGDWTIVMLLGPFYDLNFAGVVLSEWSDGTRGQGPRITQGMCLYHKYKDQGVRIWTIDQTKQEVQKVFREKRGLQPTGRALGNDASNDYLTVREVLAPDGDRRKRSKLGGKSK